MRKAALVIVIIINLGVRLIGLDRSPASLNWDEASLGYNAYSLSVSGKDEYGNKLPINLRSFDDYKPALYSYLTIIPVKIWGLSQVSVRVVSTIAGTLALIPLAWLLGQFIKNKWLVVGSVLVLGLGPIRLHFSRVALETNLSAMFFGFGMMGWWNLNKNKFNKILGGSLMMIGAVLAYHSARVAVPGVAFLLLTDPINVINSKKINIKWKVTLLSLGVSIAAILLIMAMGGGGKVAARFTSETIGRYYPYVSREVYGGSGWDWVFNNPIYYLAGMMTGHALSFISPANFGPTLYHWIRNSVQYVPGGHYIGMIETVFLVPGIWWVIKNLSQEKYRKLVYWYAAGVAPTMITWNWFHTLRGLNMLPVVELTAIMGFGVIWNKIKWKKGLGGILVVLLFFQLAYSLNNELVYSVTENYADYQPGGFKQGMALLVNLAKEADRVIIDSPHAQAYIFLLYYGQYDPLKIQEYGNKRVLAKKDGSKDFNFSNFEFRSVVWAKDQKLKNTILWTSPDTSEGEVKAVGGQRWLIDGPLKKYKAAQIIKLPN